jgi:hypothetical protein
MDTEGSGGVVVPVKDVLASPNVSAKMAQRIVEADKDGSEHLSPENIMFSLFLNGSQSVGAPPAAYPAALSCDHGDDAAADATMSLADGVLSIHEILGIFQSEQGEALREA